MAPAPPGAFLIVRMEHAVPSLAIGRSRGNAGEFIPAGIVIIMIAVRQRRPDHLRHGVGQGPEHAVAFRHRLRVPLLPGDHVAVAAAALQFHHDLARSEEHTSELQSLMRISYAVFCLKKKNKNITKITTNATNNEPKPT